MQTVISAFFDTQAMAETAIADLRAGGIPDTAISVIGQDGAPRAADGDKVVGSHIGGDRIVDADGDEHLNSDGQIHALRGILGGGALGALLGAATVAVPIVGPFFAAGAIAAAGTGFILGASTGGIVEIMTHHGITQEDASFYEQRLAAGGVLISVSSTSGLDAPRIDSILRNAGGERPSVLLPEEAAPAAVL